MTKEATALLALITLCFTSQATDPEKWNTVERLCGKAELLDRIPVKGSANSYSERRKAIRRAKVRLYQREKDSACCGKDSLLSETVTGRDGVFKFKHGSAGKYWVVIVVEGKEYPLAVTFAPNVEGREQVACSDLLYDVTEGKLQMGRVITVD